MLRQQPTAPVLKFAVTQPENTSFPGMPAVSPDGRYLTFSAVGQLNEAKKERGNLWPQFLPDGKHFVFYLQTDLVETSGVFEPPILRLPRQMKSGRCAAWRSRPRISSNGDRAVLAKIDGSDRVAHLCIADLNGGMTQISDGAIQKGAPNWSPDGSRIVYFGKDRHSTESLREHGSAGRYRERRRAAAVALR